MGKKTPPYPEYPAWTTARFWSFLRSTLRKAFTRWPPKYEVLAEAKRNKPKNKQGRHKYEYQCAKCKKWYVQSQVEVDHIIPCGSLKDYCDLPGFVERMFTGIENLQVLCKPCHRKKGKKDNE